MRLPAFLAAVWYWFAQAAGVILVAGAISFAVLHSFAVDGPVVEITAGPSDISRSVPYGGVLSYRASVRRNASCPGTIVSSFTYDGGGPPVAVVLSRPISSTEIKRTDNITTYIQLPESVYPGRWIYRSVVDSACPTYSRQDVIVQFPFEVVRNVE